MYYKSTPQNQLRPFRSQNTAKMEEDFLRDHPELSPFVLSDVQLTGTRIGSGAYGRVEEVVFPVGAAAKTLFAFLQEGDDSSPNDSLYDSRLEGGGRWCYMHFMSTLSFLDFCTHNT